VPIVMSSNKSRMDNPTADSEEVVRATVTGVDTKGQIFRRPATILIMDGSDCMFRSDRQPESGGSVLVEFDYPQADTKRLVSHASVKSILSDTIGGFYTVVIELEAAQTKRILPRHVEIQSVRSAPPSVPARTIRSAEDKGGTTSTPRDLPSLSISYGTPQVLPNEHHEASAQGKYESGELLPNAQDENPIAVREAVRSAVASEIKQALGLIKIWVSSEIGKTLPGIVTTNLEQMIRDAVEKQISVNYEISNQALNSNVARQVADRIADLRISLEDTAKKRIEQQSDFLRTAEERVEQDLSSRVATIVQYFEESASGLEAKINASHTATEAALATSHSLKQEINDGMLPLQEALRQLNDANKSGIESFQNQATSQISNYTEQFQNQLTKVSAERAAQFSMDVENRLVPNQQQADELFEKLGAALQLLQSTARVQQERLAEYSKASVASVENEIRSILLRLAGSV